jgi:hypothetical protein
MHSEDASEICVVKSPSHHMAAVGHMHKAHLYFAANVAVA